MRRAVIVCADDFGLADDVNRAILDLVERGRLSAVSCMVGLEDFGRGDLDRLLAFAPRVDVGLHLMLTDIRPLHRESAARSLVGPDGRFLAFRGLLVNCMLRRVRPAAAYREIAAQFARFSTLAGRPPDFVDGHLHVQQFPGVREAVLRLLAQTEPQHRPYVRNNAMSVAKIVRQGVAVAKSLTLSWYGRRFRHAVHASGLRTNCGFAGVYDYRRYTEFPRFLPRFVDCMESETGILVVHPGSREPWRRMEYETLRETTVLRDRPNRFRS